MGGDGIQYRRQSPYHLRVLFCDRATAERQAGCSFRPRPASARYHVTARAHGRRENVMTILTGHQVVTYWVGAGGPPKSAAMWASVSFSESSWDTVVESYTDAIGLYQLEP